MNEPTEASSSERLSRATHGSILNGMRLSKDDDRRREARERFFKTYQQYLIVFFRRKRISDHDAEDLASDLLTKLLETMNSFQYDPGRSFRAYLHTCAENALKEFWKKHAKLRKVDGFDLEQQIAPKELQQRLEGQFDLDLLEEAKRRVRGQVRDRDWKIYVELTERPVAPEELATRYGIPRHTVDVVKSRVLNRIKSEVRKLEQQGLQEP